MRLNEVIARLQEETTIANKGDVFIEFVTEKGEHFFHPVDEIYWDGRNVIIEARKDRFRKEDS